MTEVVKYDQRDRVALLSLHNPPVNALDLAVRTALWQAVEKAEADPEIGAILIRAEGSGFSVGAEIKELGRPVAPDLGALCQRIENCTKPVIAALRGGVYGGGLELALACHFRIAARGAKLGLPEVMLGLPPRAGATQRLPRIVGAGPALSMILSGKQVNASGAEKLGLIDKLVQRNLDKAGFGSARNMARDQVLPRPTRERREGFADPAAYLDRIATVRGDDQARQTDSHRLIVDCVEAALLLPFEAGLEMERSAFDDLVETEQAQALRHVFIAQKRAAIIPERAHQTDAAGITRVGVVGARQTGAGIAIACLDAGLSVTLVDQNEKVLARAHARIAATYDRSIERGRMSEADKSERLAGLMVAPNLLALADADAIIEAIAEDEAAKRALFSKLDQLMKPEALLASNTAYLDIDALAAATSRPERVLGLHFFTPAHVMNLVEVIVGRQTASEMVAAGFALVHQLGKIAVRVDNVEGFVGNRILEAYRVAADLMLEDGATPMQIDAAMRDYGFTMGPYQVLDMAGLDISWSRRKRQAGTRAPDTRYVAIGDRLCERGWFGQKSGRGYYRYDDGPGKGSPDPEVLALIDAERAAKGITRRSFGTAEIQRRCLNAMTNEGARLVEDGVVLRPSDIDVVAILGLGFPHWRGGPMMAADLHGLLAVENEIRIYTSQAPHFWALAPLIDYLIKNGLDFSALNQE